MRSPYDRHVMYAALAILGAQVEVRFVDPPAPEPPRLDVLEQLKQESRGTPTKGPAPRRRFPVRR